MNHQRNQMTDNIEFFAEFAAHTRLKHRILDAYTMAWAMKLLMWRGAGENLYIVDAFAGEGTDESGNVGSPIIIARNALKAMTAAKAGAIASPRVHVIVIEKSKKRFDALTKKTLAFQQKFPGMITLLHGELSEHIDDIISGASGAPTFYFLDPFGIKGLDAATYPKALAGAHNEIFALFNGLGASRLHAQIVTEPKSADAAIARIRESPSLFAADDDSAIEIAQRRAEQSNNALEVSAPYSRQHLIRALGRADCIDIATEVAPSQRADTFLQLFRAALEQSGARSFVTLPMRDDTGILKYSLVHASKSVKGTVAMKAAISSGLKQTDMASDTAAAMRRDLSVPLNALVDTLAAAYRGRSVRWTDEGQAAGLGSVILAYIPIFQFQMPELKATLKKAGYMQRVSGREICVFPEVT